MAYTKFFSPEEIDRAAPGNVPRGGDKDRDVYVFDNDELILAVNVALVTRRPMLVYGPPGSGKSTLAANVARRLGWRYYSEVITARTEPEELLWKFDALQQLSDARGSHVKAADSYYQPGVLWKAFASSPDAKSAEFDGEQSGASLGAAVVLLDEIDKADPDLPNSLLGPLGEWRFKLPDGRVVEAAPNRIPLVFITSNDERDLSGPFLRRCVVVTLPQPTREHLVTVAKAHLGEDFDAEAATAVADQLIAIRRGVAEPGGHGPGTAEYLDALRACRELEISVGSPEWKLLSSATLLKRYGGGEGR